MKDEMQKEIEGVRDLIRQHIILSDRKEQLEPLNLNKGKAITDGITDGFLVTFLDTLNTLILVFSAF
jgi:hypothetical protein